MPQLESEPVVTYHTACGRFVCVLTSNWLCMFDKLEGSSVTTTLSDAVLILRMEAKKRDDRV